MPPENRAIPCQFRLHRKTLDQLDSLAERLSLTRTDVVRLAVARLHAEEQRSRGMRAK